MSAGVRIDWMGDELMPKTGAFTTMLEKERMRAAREREHQLFFGVGNTKPVQGASARAYYDIPGEEWPPAGPPKMRTTYRKGPFAFSFEPAYDRDGIRLQAIDTRTQRRRVTEISHMLTVGARDVMQMWLMAVDKICHELERDSYEQTWGPQSPDYAPPSAGGLKEFISTNVNASGALGVLTREQLEKTFQAIGQQQQYPRTPAEVAKALGDTAVDWLKRRIEEITKTAWTDIPGGA